MKTQLLRIASVFVAIFYLVTFLPIIQAEASTLLKFQLTYKNKVVPNSPVTVYYYATGGGGEPIGYTDSNGNVSLSLKDGRSDISFAGTGNEEDFATANTLAIVIESGIVKSVTSMQPNTGEIKIDATNTYQVELDKPNFVFRVFYKGTPLSNIEIDANFSYGAYVRYLTNKDGYGSIRIPDFPNNEFAEIELLTRYRQYIALKTGVKDDIPVISLRLKIRTANGLISSVTNDLGQEITPVENGIYNIALTDPNFVFEIKQGDKVIKSGSFELQNALRSFFIRPNFTGVNSINIAPGLSILKIYSFSESSSIDVSAFFVTSTNGMLTKMMDFDGQEIPSIGGVYQAKMQLPNVRVRVSDGINFLNNVSIGMKGSPEWLISDSSQAFNLGTDSIHDFNNFYLPNGSWELYSSASGSALDAVAAARYKITIENNKVTQVVPFRDTDRAEFADSYVVLYPTSIKQANEIAVKLEAEAKEKRRAEARAKDEAEAKAAIEAKLKVEAEAKAAEAKAAAAKKTTITCIKGKLTKKVTAIKPKCPTGYKLKK